MNTLTNLMNRPSDPSLVELKQRFRRGTGKTTVVRAEHLSKRFGALRAVDDLTFSLKRGTVTGFLGPNGAGKTTTLRMLLHLVEPSAGRALVFGRRYQDLERPAAQVGAVLEAADFHPGRSGRDHLFSLALALGRGAHGGHWFRERERAAATRAWRLCSIWSSYAAPVAAVSAATRLGCGSGSDLRPRFWATPTC
jgi:ABC-type cobalamin/Fe3+-siderophores transport system ATPase subunit